MNENLKMVKASIYDRLDLKITRFEKEAESREYDACRFRLGEMSVVWRTAKITPTKAGQFVTFWKRSCSGPIRPLNETDSIDFFIVNVQAGHQFGQFVFTSAVLIANGVISTTEKEGKRAFRVYPPWDVPKSKQAARTQKWQLTCFYEIETQTDFDRVSALYGCNSN